MLDYIFLEVISIIFINIIILIYTFIASDQLSSMIGLTFYLILLTPFLLLLENFRSSIIFINYDRSYYNLMMQSLLYINFLIGLLLFIQILYLFLFS
jgi:hypothetical protein